MILYGAVIPSFDTDKGGKGKDGGKMTGRLFEKDEVIDSRDPKNKQRLIEIFKNLK